MATDREIKTAYVRDILSQHGDYLLKLFNDSIEQTKLIDKGDLKSSLGFNVSSGNDFDGELRIKFLVHGRFQDIGTGRKPKGIEDKFLGTKKGGRKPHKWYTRNVYGSLNNLVYRVAHSLDDEMISMLKNKLENLNIDING